MTVADARWDGPVCRSLIGRRAHRTGGVRVNGEGLDGRRRNADLQISDLLEVSEGQIGDQNLIATRRLSARPSLVSLSAAGASSPKLAVFISSSGI